MYGNRDDNPCSRYALGDTSRSLERDEGTCLTLRFHGPSHATTALSFQSRSDVVSRKIKAVTLTELSLPQKCRSITCQTVALACDNVQGLGSAPILFVRYCAMRNIRTRLILQKAVQYYHANRNSINLLSCSLPFALAKLDST